MQAFLYVIHQFFVRRSRTSLLILVIAATSITVGSWQLAYALYGANDDQSPSSSQQSDSEQVATDPDSPQGHANAGDPQKSEGDQSPDNNTSSGSTSTGGGSGSTGSNGSSGKNPGGTSTTPNGSAPTGGSTTVARNALGVPVSGTVLTLSGLNYNAYNDMPLKFQGIFSRAPYTMKKVEYPASLASDSITKGVAALDSALRSTPGQKIVLAQSQGAQVASRWMRENANNPNAPSASSIVFILSGNPLRSSGGYLIGRFEVGGTIGKPTPTNTKWAIIDVARRYDGWADWVQNSGNKWAVDNANAGKSTVHTGYHLVNLYASTHTKWKSGNTTYILTKEDTLPLWQDNSAYPLGVRTAMRAYIESAYSRPANDPRTGLLPIESAEWQDQLRGWGVPF